MDTREWIDAFAAEIGADPPADDEIDAILALAATAAHASQRTAAPVACWLGGRVGASLADLRAAAERVGGDPSLEGP
jgi:3-oxoacyl-[acyl-carrier-protein] synthase III